MRNVIIRIIEFFVKNLFVCGIQIFDRKTGKSGTGILFAADGQLFCQSGDGICNLACVFQLDHAVFYDFSGFDFNDPGSNDDFFIDFLDIAVDDVLSTDKGAQFYTGGLVKQVTVLQFQFFNSFINMFSCDFTECIIQFCFKNFCKSRRFYHHSQSGIFAGEGCDSRNQGAHLEFQFSQSFDLIIKFLIFKRFT